MCQERGGGVSKVNDDKGLCSDVTGERIRITSPVPKPATNYTEFVLMRTLAFRHGHPVSRGRDACWLRVEGGGWGALLAVIIVLVVTAPFPPSLPSFDNTDTNNQARQVDGRLDLTAQVSSVASFRKNRFRRTNEICYYSQAKYN